MMNYIIVGAEPVAYRYTDSFGTYYTDDIKDILDTPGVEGWTPLYACLGSQPRGSQEKSEA